MNHGMYPIILLQLFFSHHLIVDCKPLQRQYKLNLESKTKTCSCVCIEREGELDGGGGD